MGICQGGIFSTCYAALFSAKVARLILTVTPLDFYGDIDAPVRGSGYMSLWARSLAPEGIDALVDSMGQLARHHDRLLVPDDEFGRQAGQVQHRAARPPRRREEAVGFLRMERWISDRPNNPGEVVRQWLKDLYQGNKLVKNELVLDGRAVDLKRITMPVLNVYADGDVVVPNPCSQGMKGRFGTKDYTELGVPGGHIGTLVGGKAQKTLAPSMVEWLTGAKHKKRPRARPGS